ncbi:MAG: motif-containing protein putative exosortase substrate [Verrucomicrobiales bacterium]|nr:motif-containing protein putative exosortase substrate [Verrucomicrobiales bacterium]
MPGRRMGIMKRNHSTLLLLGTLLLPPAASAAGPNAAEDRDASASRTLAPYFSVSGNPAGPGLGLVKTNVAVQVTGTLADVVVEQIYTNRGTAPIEAEYVFPASTRAAVHGMEMKVGERRISAVIQEKAKAAAIYAAAKSEKKTAALLEQKRPNVFRMQVANIAPGDTVAVTLHYSETVSSTARVYEFVFPTVVGPRYSVTPVDSPEGKADAWVGNPYLNPARPAGSDPDAAAAPQAPEFAINVRVRAGMPVQSMACPTHETDISYPDAGTTTLALKPGTAATAGNRDFVLRYQLADRKVSSGLLLHRGEKENFFWLTMQPPARIAPTDIPPREYLFIVDVSGSMNGFPLDTAKNLMRGLIGGMGPADSFNVMLFAGAANVLSPNPLPADAANLQRALDLIDGQGAGGGTNLLPALEKAFALPGDENRSRSIVLITDGFVDCERKSFEIVRKGLGKANFFAFGIGSSVNRFLIEGLARAGRGEPFVVLDQAACAPAAKRFKEYIDAPVLTDVKVEFDGVETSAMEPWSVPDVFAERPVELFGKWSGEPRGKIRVSGIAGREPVSFEFDLATAAAQGTDNPALATLWARQRVQRLGDDFELDHGNGDIKNEITALGLNYHLLTEFTSFVAVDETPRPELADARHVTQPLPLPQGVSPTAVGGGTAGTVPEPGGLLLILIAAIAVLSGRVRPRTY